MRRFRLRLVSTERQGIADLAVSGDSLFADVLRVLDGSPGLRQSLTELPQVLQVCAGGGGYRCVPGGGADQ